MRYRAITILGKDREGILTRVIDTINSAGARIVDIQQSVIHGILSLFILAEITPANDGADLRERMADALSVFELKFHMEDVPDYTRDSRGEMYVVTIVGENSGNILSSFTRAIASAGMNNVRINMLSRGDISAMQFIIDLRGNDPSFAKRHIEESLSGLRADVIFEPESTFRMGKKLIVFDMDSTLVSNETIDELASIAGVRNEVASITERAMKGEIDYAQSIRERVRLLRGMPLSVLEAISESLELSPGAAELVSALRSMKYRIALVSGGFTIFTEKMKRELNLDYAFGNRLEVRDGRLTGNLEEPILDAYGKQRVIEEILMNEGISSSEVVVIGDGANDTVMVRNAGLGIAFRGKDVLRRVADGTISRSDLTSVLYCLGHYNE
ncbi:MAG: phosphoserine phosphatase SerB [Thermoplasmata archaeon]|uniref:phosphoserine phosphatase n=1 Tax=Candidatus Sysuiplasma superficiale TaxID=2823368 RepID=A0A8J7YQ67_9ARCH|nr:phosphoserine phosphatase SerB [Candidatus Sysuiplasma superficiale]MBX8643544.1 phosphoserine phosphatase SerB [Candidatus Sysuiplasma superficiale]